MGFKAMVMNSFNLSNKHIPEYVANLNGKIAHGPNCWNATIMFFEPNESVRYVEQKDMIKWLEANTSWDRYKRCEPRTILALFSKEEGLIHTAVYVAPGILWHKRGCGGAYEFVTEKQLRKIYFEATSFEYLLYSDNK